MLENGGKFTMLHQLSYKDWVRHLDLWQHRPWQAWDSHQGGYVLAAAFAIGLPIVRFLLRTLIYEPVGRRYLPKTAVSKKTDKAEVDSSLQKKFDEAAWKATFYFSVLVVGIIGIWHEKFVKDTKYFWIGCNTFPPCNYDVPLLIRMLYSMELGFYVQAIPYLIFWEVRRKDFWENFGHHLATIGLIVYSYEVNFIKIGAMVFLCHDINDVFMETAKMVRYAEKIAAANTLFLLFVISWFASRMFYFPVWVIRSAMHEPNEIIADIYNIDPHPHQEIFLGLLCFLFALHCYWSFLILRILVNKMITGVATDIREEAADAQKEVDQETPGIRSA